MFKETYNGPVSTSILAQVWLGCYTSQAKKHQISPNQKTNSLVFRLQWGQTNSIKLGEFYVYFLLFKVNKKSSQTNTETLSGMPMGGRRGFSSIF